MSDSVIGPDIVVGPGDYFGSKNINLAILAKKLIAGDYKYSMSVGYFEKNPETKLDYDYVFHDTDWNDEKATFEVTGGTGILEFNGDICKVYMDKENKNPECYVVIYSNISSEHALETANKFVDIHYKKAPLPEGCRVEFKFHYMTSSGPSHYSKTLDAREWDKSKRNYAETPRTKLNKVFSKKKLFDTDGKLLLLYGPPGTGKEQPCSEPVLTPSGWASIGSIKTGDAVIGRDGTAVKVAEVFPQGLKDVYTVTFSDGSSTRCGLEHLWKVQTKDDRASGRDRVISLEEIINTGLYLDSGHKRYSIPMAQPADLVEEKLPVDPYLLGLLLGDGNLVKGYPKFSSADAELVEAVRNLVPTGVTVKHIAKYDYALVDRSAHRAKANPLTKALRDLGVMGLKSETKFIPAAYYYGGWENRLALLQGLMDSDGTAGRSGTEFSTTSELLAYGVQDLARSLGGTATVKSRHTNYTYKGEKKTGLLSYRVRVKLPSSMVPFRLKRKAEKYVVPTKYQAARYISNVVKEEYQEESVCLMLDSDEHLYVTKDYIVTHNTNVIRALANEWKEWAKFEIIMDPEVFLNSASYMTGVVGSTSAKHRVIVMEDSGELIAEHARSNSGQGLSRLLNLADGILGQGQRLTFLITTNEDIQRLEPAVTRPGRCLAQVEVGKFTAAEASEWLGKPVNRAMTLADMYSEQNASLAEMSEDISDTNVGMYL